MENHEIVMFGFMFLVMVFAIIWAWDRDEKYRSLRKKQMPDFELTPLQVHAITNYVRHQRDVDDVIDKHPELVARMFYLDWRAWDIENAAQMDLEPSGYREQVYFSEETAYQGRE